MNKTAKPCTIDTCDAPARRRGWCGKHYQRWYHHGDPEYMAARYETCQADDCDRNPRSTTNQWCEMHYYRLYRNSTLAAAPWHRRGSCTVHDCSEAEENSGMCAMHAARQRRHGSPHITLRQRQIGPCEIDGCDRPKESKGLCELHARRNRLNGDPLVVLRGGPPSGEGHPWWVGDAVGYAGWHARIVKEHGRAAEHACVDCGLPAQDWSYNHDAEAEIDSPDGPYALDADHYSPRCKPCHIALDLHQEGSRWHRARH